MNKETVTMFNLEAAFKALNEIEAPVVSNKEGYKANRIDLKEHFAAKTAHEVLVEDYYDINDAEDLNTAQEEREAEIAKAKLARIEKIVDLDAETEEDILPSYVGKVIMQCPQCMTLFYKNEEDIEKSEETPEVVNINEICQHCGNSSGYTLVGKVGGIEESEAENFDLDEIEIDENELDLDFPEEGTEEVDAEGTGEAGEAMEEGEDLDLDFDFGEEEEESEEANESLHNSKLLDKIEDKNILKTEIESEHLTLNEDLEDLTDGAEIKDTEITKILTRLKKIADADGTKIGIDNMSSQADLIKKHCSEKECNMLRNVELTDGSRVNMLEEDLADWYRKTFDRPASTATQQAWEDELNGEMGEISDERRKHLERKFQQQRDWEERHPDKVKSVPVLKPNPNFKAEEEPIEEPVAVGESVHNSELLDKIEDKNNLKTNIESDHLTLNEGDDYWRDRPYTDPSQRGKGVIEPYQKPAGYKGSQSEWENKCRQSNEFNKHRNPWESLDPETDTELTEGDDYWRNREYNGRSQRGTGVIKPYQKPAGYNGSQAEWERGCRDSEENNRKLRRNPWEGLDAEEAGTKEPLTEDATDKLFDKLWSMPQPTEEETISTLASFEKSVDTEEDFEEFDEAFDAHITEYLKEVYSNIESYTSTNCSMTGKKLIVEGMIKFQSGRKKATKFTFDSSRRLNNSLIFRGMNEGLTSEKSAFRLACKTENKKLITESFSYKYNIDGSAVKGNTKKN
jgi:hypothetical protein